MKIAIVCDWLITLGGAEKVLGEMLACFPEADLFAVVDFLDESQRKAIANKFATTTFIQKLPFAKSKYRNYLPLMPLAIERLDLSSYDLILSSSHAVAKGVMKGPKQVHISYVHTPMRYAWDLQHQYLHESGLDQKWYGFLVRYILHRLRRWDLRSAKGVDHFIASSHYIAERIQRIYRREAEVIYPAVEVAPHVLPREKANYYLTASRLVPYKRVDLIVDTFRTMPDKQLIVIGSGPDLEKIKSKSAPNIAVLGYQEDAVLRDHLMRAKAFIFAADEDFGILPLEAQAYGTPVIAYGKGGALETIRGVTHAEPTGLFFEDQTVSSLSAAIHRFESLPPFLPHHCIENAARFKSARFREQLTQSISRHLSASLR